jgi:APA family basic amino acid/polyamine antiporter
MADGAAGRRAAVGGAGAEETWREAWRRWNTVKPLSAYEREARQTKLAKALGARDLTVLGVSAIIGAGIFVLPGVGVAAAGPALVLGFVVAGVASAFAALNYSELATMLPISGSAYAYSYATVGELLAWLVGWNLVLEYALGNVAVAVGWSGSFASLLAGFGVNIPVQFLRAWGTVDPTCGSPSAVPGACVPGLFNIPAFLIVMLITVVLIKGVKESARTATGIVAVKLFVLLFVIFFGAFYIHPENYNPFAPFGVLGIMGSAALVFFAYIGFDAVSTAAEETKDPGRDLPIGIIASLVISTVLYIAVTLVLTGITPWQNIANSPAPTAQAFHFAGLDSASVLIAVGSIVGITGVLLVFQLGMPRIFMSMARDGLLPRFMAKVHPKYHTPYVTTIVGSIIVGVFAGLTPLAAAAELVNIGTLFAFLVVSVSVLILRKRLPNANRPFKVPYAPWIPLVGIGFIFALMASLQVVTLIRFVFWTGVGLILYGFYGARRSALRAGIHREVVLEERGQAGRGRAAVAPRRE